MKNLLFIPLMLVALSCGKPSEHSGHEHDGDANGDNPNQALYDQVMSIHDEVMPKMEDLYKVKKELEDKIANTPNMVAEEKAKLEKRIARVDSISNLMMDWMHGFNPLPDSADQELAREYLETELEKVKKVKEAMLEALQNN
ncbi:MAG: hypothetical protein K2U26_10705 [Cyclobacteriaceae bacterium]|nr:hypothetical protein [Cyclobacteriaceae bacterium]